MELEARQDRVNIQTLITNYQGLVESLRKRDDIIQKQFDHQDVWLAHHCQDIEGHQNDLQQLADDQVGIVTRMTGYEAKACHCGEESECLSNLSYCKPVVVLLSGGPFLASQSPSPIPVPLPTTSLPAAELSLPSSRSSDSDKENSSPRSFESAQPIMTELVEIEEVGDEEAKAVSDEMDAQVWSRLYQHCKSKHHPSCYHPFPKDWTNGGYLGWQSF
ncbi:MAG TPA: hypothetical protein VHV10_08735 [Ktedonobacteraceae bacterium]|nr:hypothetical protein [Ktedonobacteraceae bacterium]